MAHPESLDKLIEDGVIDDVRARLMSGKEAAVFIVERKGELLAAKVYKDREQRTFKATASYTEGRNQTRNSRDKRAMGKKSNYGKELLESSWRDMEFAALQAAYQAGVRVPEPLLLYEDVLLMELLVDENGAPAPRLADFDLTPEVATLLHREVYGQVRLLLASGRIHGDLSAFNVLIARDGATLIDLPQVVDASGNNSAPDILRRDLCNVTEHLARFDARLLRFRDCGDALWAHYQRGTLHEATEPEVAAPRGQARGGRRMRDAERGRAGRGPSQRAQPGRDSFAADGGAAPPRGPGGHVSDNARPPQHERRPDQGPRRHDGQRPADGQRQQHAPGPPQHDRGPPRQHDRGPPRQHDRGPPQQHDRGPPRQHDRGPQQQHDRGPPQQQDRGPPQQHDRGPPQQQHDRGPPQRQDRGPARPRHEGPHDRPAGDRPPQQQRPWQDQRPQRDDRPRHDGGPPQGQRPASDRPPQERRPWQQEQRPPQPRPVEHRPPQHRPPAQRPPQQRPPQQGDAPRRDRPDE